MSPLNRGPLLGPRMPPAGMRPPLPRFGGRLPPMPGMPLRMLPPMGHMFGPMRQRMMPPRPGVMMRPGGPPPPLFGPRARGVPPLMPPMMGPRGMGPRGLPIRPPPRGILPPQGLAHPRPRFPMGNGNPKGKPIANAKRINKLEELELKKPWMTDEIRGEIQKKNKLYVRAKKSKDAKEWDEFKDLRNKVTRMIRDAKNDYLAKHPEQAHIYEGVDDDQPYDQRDENHQSSEDETSHYCEICDREFFTDELLQRHVDTHKICGIDGCIFAAHPKIVEKHISMQHCTGLYRRMQNLTTPEDIQKWIAERKKKYPTKSNVNRKEAEKTEMKERGEIIESRNSAATTKFVEKSTRAKKRKTRKRKMDIFKPESTVSLYQGLRPFAGIADLSGETDDENADVDSREKTEIVTRSTKVEGDISDEDDETTRLNETTTTTTKLSRNPAETGESSSMAFGLASLVANYGNDSTDDDGPVEVPIKRTKSDLPVDEETSPVPDSTVANITEHVRTKIPKTSEAKSGTTKNVESTRKARDAATTDDKSKQRNNRSDATKNPDNGRRSKHPMLLQRLLSRSIQHERNLICQCIKYIADNDFLQ